MTDDSDKRGGLSRRHLLGAAGVGGAAGLALGVAGHTLAGGKAGAASGVPLTALGSAVVPFHGTHQAGIVEPMQATLHATAFDLTPVSPTPSPRSPPFPRTGSTAPAATATCGCRSARTTRSSPSTRPAPCSGSPPDRPRPAGR
jgi:hypothetical protein